MNILIIIAAVLISLAIGFLVGMIYRKKVAESKIQGAENEAKRLIDLAKKEGENLKKEEIFKAKEEIMNNRKELDQEIKERRGEVQKQESRLIQKEENLERRSENFERKEREIERELQEVEKQKEEAEKQLAYYKKLGCGENEDITSCEMRVNGNSVPSASGFYRPMVSGYVTQNWMNAGHLGIDLSNTNKTIEIYPVASGVVFAKYYDTYGALVLKIRHNVNGRYIYSTYAHLSAWYVNVGDVVTPDTVIGRMGNTGYSFGAHLHLELTTCDWHAGGGCTWATYQNSTINPRQYIGFPSGLRVWWNGR